MIGNVSGLAIDGFEQCTLRIIAQGVINSLFAKRPIRYAPVVREVVEQEHDLFAIHLDDRRVSLIKVTVAPEEFLAEAVRKAVLRRLGTRDRTVHE